MVIGWTECYDDSGVTRRHQSTLCIGVFFVKVHVWSTMWDPAAPANYYKKKTKKKHAVLGRIHLPDRRLRSIILRVRHVLLISVHIDCFFKGVVCEDVGMFDCKRHMLNTYVGGSFAQNVCGDIWLMTATCNWKAFAKSTLQCLSSKDIMKFNNLKMGKYIRGKKSALQSA